MKISNARRARGACVVPKEGTTDTLHSFVGELSIGFVPFRSVPTTLYDARAQSLRFKLETHDKQHGCQGPREEDRREEARREEAGGEEAGCEKDDRQEDDRDEEEARGEEEAGGEEEARGEEEAGRYVERRRRRRACVFSIVRWFLHPATRARTTGTRNPTITNASVSFLRILTRDAFQMGIRLRCLRVYRGVWCGEWISFDAGDEDERDDERVVRARDG